MNGVWQELREAGWQGECTANAVHEDAPVLCYAVCRCPDAVPALLLQGADPNAVWGAHSALMLAAEAWAVKTIRALLRAGANPNAKVPNKEGRTPLLCCLLSPSPASSPQGQREARKSVLALRLLLAAGANPNTPNSIGITPLMKACQHRPSAVGLLLEKGADATSVDHRGRTVLYWAKANPLLYESLLLAGADPDRIGKDRLNSRSHIKMAGHAPLLEAAEAAAELWRLGSTLPPAAPSAPRSRL